MQCPAIACLAAYVATAMPAAAAPRPVVLELFTSESCSSCPPADALLMELATGRPDLLPLGFHVDYWNALGWKDRYASPAATARQRAYAAALGAGVFTPQLVIDGRWQAVGSDHAAVQVAIRRARAEPPAGPGLATTDANGRVTVQAGAAAGAGDVLLIGFDSRHTTQVGAGENDGRSIDEANVVRSLTRIGAWSGRARSFDAARPAGQRVAVLVQGGDGRILAAVLASPYL
jgi:hypothetical protein